MTMAKLAYIRRPLMAAMGVLALIALSSGRRGGMLLSGAGTASIDRAARDYRMPDQVEWKGRPGSDTQTAIVFGDPSKPGLFIQLLKRGPDNWSQPHTHPYDRMLTVLAGEMRIGTGSKFDKENTVALGPGSFIKDFANQVHYDGTGPNGLTLEIVAMGPVPPEGRVIETPG